LFGSRAGKAGWKKGKAAEVAVESGGEMFADRRLSVKMCGEQQLALSPVVEQVHRHSVEFIQD